MLTGIEVLDLADEKASYCTKILAMLGARVIKIEPPGGDPARGRGPFLNPDKRDGFLHTDDLPDPGNSLSFYYLNTNKLSITLNLGKPEGRRLFLRLIKRADVLVETFLPSDIEKLACEYEILRDINNRLIHVSVTGFGRKGPRSDYQSGNLVAAAYGGSMYISGSHDTPPLKPGGEQHQFTGSLFAVLGILLALNKRRQNGNGEYLDLSLQEAVTATLEHVLVRYFHDRITTSRRGARHWNDAFCVLPCRDGFIQMTVFQQWETLIGLMASEGRAGDLEEDRWSDETYRHSQSEHIIEIIGAWTRNHSVQELFQLGQLMGFPWAPVQSPAAVLECEQLKDRGFFIPLRQKGTGEAISSPGLPFRFSNMTLPPLKSAPAPGEDNVNIYCDELGLSEEKLKRLSAEGII